MKSGRGVYQLIKNLPHPETPDGIKGLERKLEED